MGISMQKNFFDEMTGATRLDELESSKIERSKYEMETLQPENMQIDRVERLLNWIYRDMYPEKAIWTSSRRAEFNKHFQRFKSINPHSDSRENALNMIREMLEIGQIDSGISYRLALGITLY